MARGRERERETEILALRCCSESAREGREREDFDDGCFSPGCASERCLSFFLLQFSPPPPE